MLLRAARIEATTALEHAAVPSPRVDAELLLAFVLDWPRSAIQLGELRGDQLDDVQLSAYRRLIARRAQRIPLQHLTGQAHFRYLNLKVGPGVFIPRPETESVVQVGVDYLANRSGARCVDLCAGSGAIAAALATELVDAKVWAVELSEQAIGYTRENCEPYGVQVIHADASALPQQLGLDSSIDLVISNPPYIPPNAVPREVEVKDHDPQMALYGLGSDGLEIPRAIARQGLQLLKPGALFVMEHAEVQAPAAAALLAELGYQHITGHLDLARRPRATSGHAPDNNPRMKE